MKRLLFSIAFLVLFLNACANTQQKASLPNDVLILSPEEVVRLYFNSWNNKQYDAMYSLISDGFKQIEPTATSFDDFKAYMSKFYDTSSGVIVIDVKVEYENENEAGVNYKIEIIGKDGSKKEFSSTYSLKKRANGWKLIHPYGQNIDTT